MSKGQTLRALVIERLAAAAEDIFVLFERTIAEYEEELRRSKAENQRKPRLLDQGLSQNVEVVRVNVQVPSTSPGSNLNQEISETPRIKEEPEEQIFKQEEEHLSVCVKAESSSLFQHRQTKHRGEPQREYINSELHFHSELSSDTDHDDHWESFSCSEAQMETEADGHCDNQVQVRDRSFELFPQNESAPETTVHNEDASRAEPNAHLGSVCGERFSTNQILHEHIAALTREQQQSCTICHKTFSSKQSLVRHSRRHTVDKPYRCSICGKTFSVKGDLNKHMRIHTGEKPYSCSVCEKTFSLKGDLNKHMRIHTGEKPFRCSLCEKAFALKGNLNQHMRFHRGEKPHICSLCEKSFTLKGDLNKHMRIHTGEKPYNCSVCEKPFALKSDLNKHENVHRGNLFQLYSV